tara:strand:- start:188 stop:712 length:525 start_codon:yes stop_codon:yes gene_type:complete
MNDLNPRKYIITYGIYTGLALISWLIMLFILKAHYENSWTRFFTEITIQLVGIVLAALAYKKNNLGLISIKETLKIGVGVSLLISIFSVCYLAILSNFIEPDFFDKTYELSYFYYMENYPEALEMQGISDKNKFLEISHSRTIYNFIFTPVILCFIGLLLSFFSGLIIKKNKQL